MFKTVASEITLSRNDTLVFGFPGVRQVECLMRRHQGARLITNRAIWPLVRRLIHRSKGTIAAIAYFSSGAADLLPLQRGDTIVVDMSLKAVSQGVTDPREIAKLIRDGVKVYSRGSLHAKIIVTSEFLLVGSANASSNSANILDEAAIVISNRATISAARQYINLLCTEPVRDEYLQLCKQKYNRPTFKAVAGDSPRSSTKKGRAKRAELTTAKLWFLGRIARQELSPANEALIATRAYQVAEESGKDVDDLSWIKHLSPPRIYSYIKPGDWVIDSDQQKRVDAPRQVISKGTWRSAKGTKYSMIWVEDARNGESLPWNRFRRLIAGCCPSLDQQRPRPKPISDIEQADDVLRLWTSSGTLSKRARRRSTALPRG